MIIPALDLSGGHVVSPKTGRFCSENCFQC